MFDSTNNDNHNNNNNDNDSTNNNNDNGGEVLSAARTPRLCVDSFIAYRLLNISNIT